MSCITFFNRIALSLSEALVVLGLVSYQAFLTYIEWKKAKEIHEDYDKRLSQIENKLSLLNLGRNLSK